MSTHHSVQRDERTEAIENASYKWAFAFITFALLIDVMCRAAFRHEAAWDLMFLACVPGMICGIYQARQRTLGQGWAWKLTLVGSATAFVAAIVAAIFTMTKAM